MNRVLQKTLRAMLVVAVLGAGGAAFVALTKSRSDPTRKPAEERAALVETIKVEASNEKLSVRAQGTVTPAQRVAVMPEVGGRVVWQSKDLVPGGRFKRGQPLVRIDSKDYALAARQQEAAVDRARLELQLEASRKEIAKQEWDIIGEGDNVSPEDRALALREPQLQVAKAAVESAESAQAQAKLALGRTSLSAPFNAIVQSENVDVGQLVSPASQLAVLVGTDAYWVQVSVPVEQLVWIDVPGLNAEKGAGSAALVWQDVGGERVERPGQVVRLLGDLDPVGRMARVLVEIEDPLRLKEDGHEKLVPADQQPAVAHELPSAKKLPFLIGAYVNIEVEARQVKVPVVELPRLALHDGDHVYVYGAGDKLDIRKVDIVWRSEKSVLVRAGVKPGDLVITSRLAGAVPGMRLRKVAASDGKALGKR